MTKDVRRDAQLAAHFRTLNEIPLPARLATRLRSGMDRPASGLVLPRLVVAIATAALLLAGFAIGRESAPMPSVSSTPRGTAATASLPVVLGTVREGNLVLVQLSGAGTDPDRLRLAHLRLSDGTDLLPDSVVIGPDGAAALRYGLPSQFGFIRSDARIELPLGTGVWVGAVDLR